MYQPLNDEQVQTWVRQRLRQAGAMSFVERDTGTSSNAMVDYALGGNTPDLRNEAPGDLEDLRACQRARDGAPEALHERMDEVLARYREVLGIEPTADIGMGEDGIAIDDFVTLLNNGAHNG